MENYNGIAISNNDKEFVVAFDNFVNGKMQSATNTGKALATIHRYLQSQAFKVCVAYIRQLAVNYRTGYYDERNETTARRAAMMYDTLMNGDEIYDPEYKELRIKAYERHRFSRIRTPVRVADTVARLPPWHNRRTERLPLHHRGKQWRED